MPSQLHQLFDWAVSLTTLIQVGAGPSGLVLALVLLKNRVPVRVIEKLTEYHHGERGPGLMVCHLSLYFARLLSNMLLASHY